MLNSFAPSMLAQSRPCQVDRFRSQAIGVIIDEAWTGPVVTQATMVPVCRAQAQRKCLLPSA